MATPTGWKERLIKDNVYRVAIRNEIFAATVQLVSTALHGSAAPWCHIVHTPSIFSVSDT